MTSSFTSVLMQSYCLRKRWTPKVPKFASIRSVFQRKTRVEWVSAFALDGNGSFWASDINKLVFSYLSLDGLGAVAWVCRAFQTDTIKFLAGMHHLRSGPQRVVASAFLSGLRLAQKHCRSLQTVTIEGETDWLVLSLGKHWLQHLIANNRDTLRSVHVSVDDAWSLGAVNLLFDCPLLETIKLPHALSDLRMHGLDYVVLISKIEAAPFLCLRQLSCRVRHSAPLIASFCNTLLPKGTLRRPIAPQSVMFQGCLLSPLSSLPMFRTTSSARCRNTSASQTQANRVLICPLQLLCSAMSQPCPLHPTMPACGVCRCTLRVLIGARCVAKSMRLSLSCAWDEQRTCAICPTSLLACPS